jgi:alkylation response protein AidB-like acyl-CoA dehydrogenase
MDFRVGDDQRELAEGIRAVISGRLPLERLRTREGEEHAVHPDDWAALGETGVFALTLPEPAGTGLGMTDAVVVFEELGRALVPGPLVGTFLAARQELVEGAAEGRVQVGVYAAGRGPAPVLVEHLAALDALLLVSDDGPPQLVTPAPTGGARRMREPLDPLTPLWRLDTLPFGGAVEDDGGRMWRDGALVSAALQVGHAAATLDLAVAYAKERQQFGQPIGAFQAVKHLCADMLVRAEVARAAVHAAACYADAPDVTAAEAQAAGCAPGQWLTRSVTGAKLLSDEAALANARSAIQVHGGMGFTWEVPLHLHLKRSRVLSTTFGTPAEASADLAASA